MKLQSIIRKLNPRVRTHTTIRQFQTPDLKVVSNDESNDEPYFFTNDEDEVPPRLHGVVNTHDKIPKYPPKISSLSNSKVPKVYAGNKQRFTSGKKVPSNWLEKMEKGMEASWIVYVIYKFAGECNDLVLNTESYCLVPPFEYEGALNKSGKQISFTASAFQVTPYYDKDDKLILATCSHSIVPLIKNNNKIYTLSEIIACNVDSRELDYPSVICEVLKDGNVDQKAYVASAYDYAFLIAKEVPSDYPDENVGHNNTFPYFLIPRPISAVINSEEKKSIADNPTDGYDHVVIGSPAPVNKTFVAELNKQFKSKYSAKRINYLLGTDYRSVSLGQVVDHHGETYNHTSGTSPGSSGSATIVLERPIFEQSQSPFPEILTFQGIHIGGGTLNYAFSVCNKNFHSDYLEYVVNNLTERQLAKFSTDQLQLLQEYVQLHTENEE